MRIAMMTNNYWPVVGGVSVSISRLSNALRALGHQVTVFAPRHPRQTQEDGVVRYRSIAMNLPGGVVLPNPIDSGIEAEFQRTPFDVIHLHHPMLIGYSGLYLGREYGLPVALTYHTRYEQYLHHAAPYAALEKRRITRPACNWIRSGMLLHNRIIANHCDQLFAPTPNIRGHLLEQGISSPIAVLPTGLASGDFVAHPERAQQIRRQYLGDKQRLFCSVSRLEKEKNIPFMLRSLARYKSIFGSDFRLLLIGEGSQREALWRQAAEMGLGENLCFTGNIPHEELSSYYLACDLFLFASRSETQGLVLLEAMAAGLPVVAVDASGVCDVVADGCNGWKTPEDPDIFASRIRICGSAAVRDRLGEMARKTAALYTDRQMALDALDTYQDMLRAWEEKQRLSAPSLGLETRQFS